MEAGIPLFDTNTLVDPAFLNSAASRIATNGSFSIGTSAETTAPNAQTISAGDKFEFPFSANR